MPSPPEAVGELVGPHPPGLSTVSGDSLSTAGNSGQQERLRGIEDRLLERSLTTVQDTLHFQEIDPDADEPPPSWVEELGQEQALQRLRLARAGWLSAKDAPVGIKVAKEVATGIIKARSTEGAAPRLAVAVQVVTSAAHYPSLEIEHG